MKITKLGHCCLLIEIDGKRILTDPGNYSTAQNDLEKIDLILITHEHADHLHIESLQTVLQKTPSAKIVTNTSVAKLLSEKNISCNILLDGQSTIIDSISLRGVGTKHAAIYSTLPMIENTGYFIQDKLFYPGDAFTHPNSSVDVLALPVAGPWMKISEAIEYALLVKPRCCFPVHDAQINPQMRGPIRNLPKKILGDNGIEFIALEEGQTFDF